MGRGVLRMKILALEFSSERRGVAVLDGGAVRGTIAATGHTPSVLALVEEVLRQARLEREAIECIVVGLGPGSYTGIRMAIALAQGWGLARGVNLLGVSSAEALAATAHATGLRGPIRLAIDAQRGDFYRADYELSDVGFNLTEPLRIIGRDELLQSDGRLIVGPEADHLGGTQMFPDATQLGLLSAGRKDFVAGERLEPIYLRETNFVKAPPLRVLPL